MKPSHPPIPEEHAIPAAYDRDLIGCGPKPPDPKWPDGARHWIRTHPYPGTGLNE